MPTSIMAGVAVYVAATSQSSQNLTAATSREEKKPTVRKRSSLFAKLPKLSIPRLSFKRTNNPGSFSGSNSRLRARYDGSEDIPYAARRLGFRPVEFRRGSFSRGGLEGEKVEPRASRSSASRPATAAASSTKAEDNTHIRDVSPGSQGSVRSPRTRNTHRKPSLFPSVPPYEDDAEEAQHSWSPATRRLEHRMPTSTSSHAMSDPRSAGSSIAHDHHYGSFDTNITTPSSGRPSKVSFALRPGIIPSSSTESYSSLLNQFSPFKRGSTSRSDAAPTLSSSAKEAPLSQVSSAPSHLQLGQICSAGLAEAQAANESRRDRHKSRLMSRGTTGAPVSILRTREYTVEQEPESKQHANCAPAAYAVGTSKFAKNAVQSDDFALPRRNNSSPPPALRDAGSLLSPPSTSHTNNAHSDLSGSKADSDAPTPSKQHHANERLQYAMGNFTWDEAVRQQPTCLLRKSSLVGPLSEAPIGLDIVSEDGPFVLGHKREEAGENLPSLDDSATEEGMTNGAPGSPNHALEDDDAGNDADDEETLQILPIRSVKAANMVDIRRKRALLKPTCERPALIPKLTLPAPMPMPRYEPLAHPSNYVDTPPDEADKQLVSAFSSSSSSDSSPSDAVESEDHSESGPAFHQTFSSPRTLAAASERYTSSRSGAPSKGSGSTYNGARVEIFRQEVAKISSGTRSKWETMDVKRWRRERGMDGETQPSVLVSPSDVMAGASPRGEGLP
ncbi:unnamed protein product [Zymoseptoria tritici ST99CH_1A5]|uniref:Uncharacterized protein n=1 Tax=Zymoseptoria tritici ST99CH_1A5 TaxID=1276529 RepID=A0A1Y6M1S7_ZYMTR|nr:unnamed protein product [Zymoseptoria tritici ST99CH_1A5]